MIINSAPVMVMVPIGIMFENISGMSCLNPPEGEILSTSFSNFPKPTSSHNR